MDYTDLEGPFAWLKNEHAPRILVEALKHLGVHEIVGSKSNKEILRWAAEIGHKTDYTNDDTPWCGLFISYCAGQAGYDMAPKGNALWARNWAAWGNSAKPPMLGDVLVFARGTAGHVALYVGETDGLFWCLGGNQRNKVSIAPKSKARLIAARRSPFRIGQPANVRQVFLTVDGNPTGSEA